MRPPDPTRIHLHHVGARDGSFPVTIPSTFDACVDLTLYEPDPSCLEQIRQLHAGRAATTRVIERALASRRARRSLWMTRDPYASSLYPAAPEAGSTYLRIAGMDYRLGDALYPTGQLELDVSTIDLEATSHGLRVDCLTLDTQGAEAEILDGATATLAGETVVVVAELLLTAFYSGQGGFADAAQRLDRQGFSFSRFLTLAEGGTGMAPIGWRGPPSHPYGDCLFLKRPEVVAERHATPWLDLSKLAFLAIATGDVESALAALTMRADLKPLAEAAPYLAFLDRVWALRSKAAPLFLPSFSQMFSPEEAAGRFNPGTLPHLPIATPERLVELRRRILPGLPEPALIAAAEDLVAGTRSAFELLLTTSGFGALAEDVARRRGDAILQLYDVLGFAHRRRNPQTGADDLVLDTEGLAAAYRAL